MKLLAALEVTTKIVERTAEAVEKDTAVGKQEWIQCALQLDLPMLAGETVPILYVEMDGTGVPAPSRSPKSYEPGRHTLKRTPTECGKRSIADNTCSSVRARSRPDARP